MEEEEAVQVVAVEVGAVEMVVVEEEVAVVVPGGVTVDGGVLQGGCKGVVVLQRPLLLQHREVGVVVEVVVRGSGLGP